MVHPIYFSHHVDLLQALQLKLGTEQSTQVLANDCDENFMSDGTLDTAIDWIPGMRDMRLKDLPSHHRTTNHVMGEEAQNRLKSLAIIFNTFDEFEQEVLEAIASNFFPRMYTVGPQHLLCRRHVTDTQINSINPSLWKENSESLRWLDRREPESVMYLNYRSVTGFASELVPPSRSAVTPIRWCISDTLRVEFNDGNRIGVEVDHDVKREEVEALVRDMIKGEKGKKLRSRSEEWKKKAEEATNVGGSSYSNLDRFIKEAMQSFRVSILAPQLILEAQSHRPLARNLIKVGTIAPYGAPVEPV
ncbi:linamarin synthase 2-like [Rhododendron vialii]|uniref:linamarin synthase 2-like n=1 Tax=Rhododendron vialii TaxID=182163 RepID=UPI002660527E|nr:linamarin synthase 2-like [Rhododendron vialii]